MTDEKHGCLSGGVGTKLRADGQSFDVVTTLMCSCGFSVDGNERQAHQAMDEHLKNPLDSVPDADGGWV